MVREEFVKQLHSGAVSFKFSKVDGSVRDAKGTLSFDLIPEEFHPKVELDENNEPVKASRKENPDVQKYFDLDKLSWRSFRWENFVVDAE